MIFVDTSAFYALAHADDSEHHHAVEVLGHLIDSAGKLVTHNYILVESFALMHRRAGISVAKAFYKDVHRLCQIHWVSQSQHERAAKTYVGQAGSALSFIDCVSFEIMKTMGIHRYFAFDEDFRRHGWSDVSSSN